MSIGISNPTIKWNGRAIKILPNSGEYNSGIGDRNVRPISAGGNAVEVVVTVNAETKKSRIKFSLANDVEAISIKNEMLRLSETELGNAFEVSQGGLIVTFRGMVVIAEPTTPMTQDGAIDLEFEGPPATESTSV